MSGREITRHASVSGALIEQIGDGFIKDNGTAISELVKNSYDADATKVIINFENAFSKDLTESRISISDNGCGMDEEGLDFFFEVGNPNKFEKKERGEFSPVFKRWYHGERGLGRFGLQKLGFYATVITRKANSPTYSFKIDWKKFSELKDITQYEFKIKIDDPKYKNAFSGDSTGTILIIDHLKKGMGGSNLQTIHRKISSLVNPFAGEDDFSIELKGLKGDKLRWTGFDQAAVVAKQAHYHFKFQLDESSRLINYSFGINHPWNPNDGEMKEGLIAPVKIEKGTIGLIDRFPKVWGLNGELYVFYRNSKVLKERPIRASWGIVTDDQWYDMCGIKIYRNNARVYPYGNRDGKLSVDDSLLGINALAASNNKAWLRQNQFIGAITFDGEMNPGLKDTSNREGLIEDNNNFRDLRDLLRGIVKFLKTELIEKSGHRNTAPPAPSPVLDRPKITDDESIIFVREQNSDEYESGSSDLQTGEISPPPPPIPVHVQQGDNDWERASESIETARLGLRELGPHSGKEKLQSSIEKAIKSLEDAKSSLGS